MAKVEHISHGFERKTAATQREVERREARGEDRREDGAEDRRDK